MKMFIILLLLTSGFSVYAKKDSCKTVDLTARNGCLSDLPPLSQGQTNNCWAFAYSTMVDAHLRCQQGKQDPNDKKDKPNKRKKDENGFRVSPWTMPMSNNQYGNSVKVSERLQEKHCPNQDLSCYSNQRLLGTTARTAVNQGASFEAADEIFRSNLGGMVCDHRSLGFADSNVSNKFFNFLAKYYANKDNGLVRDYHKYRKECMALQKKFKGRWAITQSVMEMTKDSPDNHQSCKNMQAAMVKLEGIINDFNGAACEQAFGVATEVWQWTSDLLSNINEWEADNAYAFVNNWIRKKCDADSAKRKVELPQMRGIANSPMLMKMGINARLDEGKAVGVSVCSSVFRDSDKDLSGIASRGVNFTCSRQFCGCSPHAMVIVGRKKIKGKCTFILRNSWGQGCGGYGEFYEKKGYCDAEKGNIAVPVDMLINNALDAHYFE
jgi:hypothetical protein